MQLYPWLLVLSAWIAVTPASADVLDRARAARQAAVTAEAPRLAEKQWSRAEKDLAGAVKRLERGDVDGAAERGLEAEAGYRDAELQALDSRFLSPVRSLLLTADEVRAERFAPLTLAGAREKLAVAEKDLAANRADPGKAAASIEAARLEAANAIRVASLAREVAGGKRGAEETILALEAVFGRIATAADLPRTPVAGDDVAAEALVSGVRTLRARATRAERELKERDRQIASLEEELRELDARLNGAASERDRLMMTLEAQRRSREQFTALQSLFGPEEGVVLRQGNDIVLRLTGLRFRAGSAELSGRSLPLIDKVRQAISLFPNASIVIEGHTDSSGSEADNQRLSEDRAAVVAGRLRNLLGMPTLQIQPVGYGERQPVTSNDTKEGRAGNRRIDVVIRTTEASATP